MSQIYLYGIGDAGTMYRVIRYQMLETENLTIRDIRYEANMLRIKNPAITHVYAMDQRAGLRRDYMDAFKKNSIESWAIFKDILESEGLKIY